MGRQLSGTWSGRGGRGAELLVSVGHQPGAVDKLTVVVLKARNLPSSTELVDGCVNGSPLTGSAIRFTQGVDPGGWGF